MRGARRFGSSSKGGYHASSIGEVATRADPIRPRFRPAWGQRLSRRSQCNDIGQIEDPVTEMEIVCRVSQCETLVSEFPDVDPHEGVDVFLDVTCSLSLPGVRSAARRLRCHRGRRHRHQTSESRLGTYRTTTTGLRQHCPTMRRVPSPGGHASIGRGRGVWRRAIGGPAAPASVHRQQRADCSYPCKPATEVGARAPLADPAARPRMQAAVVTGGSPSAPATRTRLHGGQVGRSGVAGALGRS
jgi:hypothetical protein